MILHVSWKNSSAFATSEHLMQTSSGFGTERFYKVSPDPDPFFYGVKWGPLQVGL